MTGRPLVSILVPVYNRESYVAEAVHSALMQTHSPIEVVVVDNASTDATWAICQELAARDKRVRIFRNPENLGPVRNWKRCLEEAKGEFGKILFSDDAMTPDFLRQALELIKRPGVAFVFSAINVGPSQEACEEPLWWRSRSDLYPSREFIQESLLGGTPPVSPGAALFRLTDLKQNLLLDIPSRSGIDFTRLGAGPDLLLYLLTASHYPWVGYLEHPLIFFRRHGGSITMAEGGTIESHYFQAKLWFAAELVKRGDEGSGRLLKDCLAYGWLKRKITGMEPGLQSFVERYVGQPVKVGLLDSLRVRLSRRRMKRRRKSVTLPS